MYVRGHATHAALAPGLPSVAHGLALGVELVTARARPALLTRAEPQGAVVPVDSQGQRKQVAWERHRSGTLAKPRRWQGVQWASLPPLVCRAAHSATRRALRRHRRSSAPCQKLGSVWHFDRAVVRVLRLAAHAQGADVATYPSLVCRERRPARSLRDDGETEKT